MKRIILAILTSVLTLSAWAQSGHIKFKGLPVDGQMSEFIAKLNEIGYETDYLAEDGAILKGDFAGKSDCNIIVVSTKTSHIVWKVAIHFPKEVSWQSLKNDYFSYKARYQMKYGEPRSYEFFSDPYYEGDGYELQALQHEKCTYASYYSLPEGTVSLSMYSEGNLEIIYEDAINVKIASREKEAFILQDI